MISFQYTAWYNKAEKTNTLGRLQASSRGDSEVTILNLADPIKNDHLGSSLLQGESLSRRLRELLSPLITP